MKSAIFALMFLFFLNVWLVHTQQQFIYTIQYAKSYRRDLLDKYMGCKQNSTIIYGTYLYPTGPKDALFVYMNQGTYQTHLSCNNQNNFVKIFGTQQDYEQLIATDPTSVANNVKQSLARLNPSYVISWKHSLKKNAEKSLAWLKTFVEKLNEFSSNKVYLKAPASYFCYQSNGVKYFNGINTNKFIIEMYGQEAGVYTNFESIFQKNFGLQTQDKQNYSEDCPKFPSYKTLVKNFAGKEILIEKTLQKEEAGYIGPKFGQFLEKGKQAYGKVAFLDSFPEQIIQL